MHVFFQGELKIHDLKMQDLDCINFYTYYFFVFRHFHFLHSVNSSFCTLPLCHTISFMFSSSVYLQHVIEHNAWVSFVVIHTVE